MKKTLILLTVILFQSCLQSDWRVIEIDEGITKLVDKNIVDTFDNSKLCFYEFTNKSLPTFYINETLLKRSNESLSSEWYEAKWFTDNDTIIIFGSNVFNDGARGFKANLINGKSEIFGYVRTHIFMGNLGLSKKGPKYNAMLIPTAQSKLILNKIPNQSDSIIYGLVEFETAEFYTFEDSYSTNFQIENRCKYHEKIYFKANKCQDIK